MFDNFVPRTRKTLYIRLEAPIVEMLETLCTVANIDQEHAISVLIEDAYDAHLANLTKIADLKQEKDRLLAQIEEIDKQLPPS
jgi:hypothetical protein